VKRWVWGRACFLSIRIGEIPGVPGCLRGKSFRNMEPPKIGKGYSSWYLSALRGVGWPTHGPRMTETPPEQIESDRGVTTKEGRRKKEEVICFHSFFGGGDAQASAKKGWAKNSIEGEKGGGERSATHRAAFEGGR